RGRIVRNEHAREAPAFPQSARYRQDVRLCRGIERCRRFIGNDDRRPTGNGLRDERALALTSAKLMRMRAANALRFLRKKQLLEDFACPLIEPSPPLRPMRG